jgi:hypothetical protein
MLQVCRGLNVETCYKIQHEKVASLGSIHYSIPGSVFSFVYHKKRTEKTAPFIEAKRNKCLMVSLWHSDKSKNSS